MELEELSANPLHRIKWKPPKTTETVDPRVVVNPRQAQELPTAVTYVGKRGRGRRLMALFACMYYAALRPGEAVALRKDDCNLPEHGWERILVDVSRPEVNTQWTNTGDAQWRTRAQASGPERHAARSHPAGPGQDSSATH
ncbi:hypothetical protein ACIBI0_17095 [Microbispora rosea]|uniref:hypothetical protein n=1 Tax=Microbispora rosea TaxID=58117 RepID=UPI00379119D0